MAERRINRQAWADLVAELVKRYTRGKKATFARQVGVDPRTVTRWLTGDVDVSETSVRDVARALGYSPVEMLVEVGYYSADELGTAAPPVVPTDEAIQLVTDDPRLSPRMKDAIIARLLELEAEDRRRRREMAQWMIDQAGGN